MTGRETEKRSDRATCTCAFVCLCMYTRAPAHGVNQVGWESGADGSLLSCGAARCAWSPRPAAYRERSARPFPRKGPRGSCRRSARRQQRSARQSPRAVEREGAVGDGVRWRRKARYERMDGAKRVRQGHQYRNKEMDYFQMCRQSDGQASRQPGRWTEQPPRHTDTWTYRHTQTHRHTGTHRQTQTNTGTHTNALRFIGTHTHTHRRTPSGS